MKKRKTRRERRRRDKQREGVKEKRVFVFCRPMNTDHVTSRWIKITSFLGLLIWFILSIFVCIFSLLIDHFSIFIFHISLLLVCVSSSKKES